MRGTDILTFILFVAIFDSSKCKVSETDVKVVQAEKETNVIDMFDRFYHFRHADEFFIHNMKHQLTEKYLREFYTATTGGLSPTLKEDFSMQAIYLENTGWYSNSFTELFSILYVKYLASDYVVEFRNCELYYKHAEKNSDMMTKCKKVARYFLSFIEFGLEKILKRTEKMLKIVIEGEDRRRQYWDHYYVKTFEALKFHFRSIKEDTLNFPLPIKFLPKKEKDIKMFFRHLDLREMTNFRVLSSKMQAERIKKLRVKYFFRNLLFGTDVKTDRDLVEQYYNENEKYLERDLDKVQKETMISWRRANLLVKKIETTDPKNSRLDGNGKREPFTSNVTKLLRYLKSQKSAEKDESDVENDIIFHLDITAPILQLYVDPTALLSRQIQFIPVTNDEMEQPMRNGYPLLTQTMKESDFSGEEFTSAEDDFNEDRFNLKSDEEYSYSQSVSTPNELSKPVQGAPEKDDNYSSSDLVKRPNDEILSQSKPSEIQKSSTNGDRDMSELSNFVSTTTKMPQRDRIQKHLNDLISASEEHTSKQYKMKSGQDVDFMHKNSNMPTNQQYVLLAAA